MRQKIKIPRILKINRIKDLNISVVFNNGETRIIDFKRLFDKLKINKDSPAYVLTNPEVFKKAIINNNTLSWNNVDQYITLKNKEKHKVPFEIGADVLLKHSHPDKSESTTDGKVGKVIKKARLKAGLTQQDLAIMSGTTRYYISRIENDRSDIEVATLRKIVEIGLGKHLEISIK